MILVTGFGPFLDVHRNPSGRLAEAVDGLRIAGHTIVGEVLPVSYRRAPARTIALARRHPPLFVLGMGVASGRDRPMVEVLGVRRTHDTLADVDGVVGPVLGEGPPSRRATLDVDTLAEALGCAVSEDAGTYVCNAWLYEVVGALPDLPVAFLHVPPAGMPRDTLLAGLRALVASAATT
ncbi:MAG: hypothetical protein H6739_04115 [Alphaproteobacteria bacterium]|nr:hypothetical protein [Alphaproteobacteria bacterium]